MDDRARALLKALIERISPMGSPWVRGRYPKSSIFPRPRSATSCRTSKLGLIHSPHTSAGRVPTPRGYRMFVDSLLAVQSYQLEPRNMGEMLSAAEPTRAVNAAAALLSNLTQFAGVVLTPKRAQIFRQIEFIRLSDKRVLLIIVTPDGDAEPHPVRAATTPSPSCWRPATSSMSISPASPSTPCAARCPPNSPSCARTSRA